MPNTLTGLAVAYLMPSCGQTRGPADAAFKASEQLRNAETERQAAEALGRSIEAALEAAEADRKAAKAAREAAEAEKTRASWEAKKAIGGLIASWEAKKAIGGLIDEAKVVMRELANLCSELDAKTADQRAQALEAAARMRRGISRQFGELAESGVWDSIGAADEAEPDFRRHPAYIDMTMPVRPKAPSPFDPVHIKKGRKGDDK